MSEKVKNRGRVIDQQKIKKKTKENRYKKKYYSLTIESWPRYIKIETKKEKDNCKSQVQI